LDPHLRLSTLGTPLLFTAGGEQIRFRTRKHFALLIRLGLESGRRFTRDYLTDLLWPDAPVGRARHSLAQAISVLKAKMGPEHLLLQKSTVGLAEGVVDVDACRVSDGHTQVRGPFLDGFEVPGAPSFEQWKDEWRAKLTPRIRDCLVLQMDAGRRIGDFAAVEGHAQLLYELDPLSEDAVRGLMEARAWAGDRVNALKICARFTAQLDEELGAKPSADLVRMAALLREGRASVPRQPNGDDDRARTTRLERRFEAETLIGREKEFAVLYDNWLEVRQRRPRVVVLTGDPGIGKTTLTNAFVSTCQMEGAVVARAQAYDAERELPFAVLAELVRQLALQRAIGSADPDALSELARIAPAVFDAFPGVPKPIEWAAEVTPLRLADAFLRTVTAAGDESPVILVVDDVHAADNASAAILHLVARKLDGTRLLLLLAGRSSELRTATAPSSLVPDSSVHTMQALELEPLSPGALERLVASVASKAGRTIQDLPTRRILQAANGNPLALELLTKEWLAHGSTSLLTDLEALNTRPVANIGIPRAIGAVFERQVRRLDVSARAALDLAAVLGRRLADLPLYDIVGLSPAAAGETLSRLREEGLLREIHGGLEFRNELIRAQAYYAVAGPARQHLHQRVAELLSERPAEDRQSLNLEIAWHFLRGGDGPKALPFALDGSEEALKIGAPYEAAQILTAVLREGRPAPSVKQRIAILLSRALLDQSKAEDAVPALEEMLADPNLSPRDLAQAACMRAAAEYLLNRETGERYCQAAATALAAARKLDDTLLITQALFECARAGAEFGDEERVRRALSELQQISEDPARAQSPVVLHALGFCHFFFFELRLASKYLERAIDVAKQSSDSVTLNYAYNGYGISKQFLCEFRPAEAAYLAGLDLAKKMGDDSRVSIIAGNLSGLRCIEGDYAGSIAFGQCSIEAASRGRNQPRLLTSYMNIAEAYMLSGEIAKAFDCIESARKLVEVERSWRARVLFLGERASLALLAGNILLALETIGTMEELILGRERAVPDLGLVERLRVFKTGYTEDAASACAMAEQAKERFRNRNLLYYLDALSAHAWAEKRAHGSRSHQTETELRVLDMQELIGKKASLLGQGFLT
jgi:DNA-binding SARP family transcriptional activator/tetratricopeptide (TPR) repeat protein